VSARRRRSRAAHALVLRPGGDPDGRGAEPLAFPPDAPPMFQGPTNLRVLARVSSVLYGPHRFTPGQVFTADALAAERLVTEGTAGVVE
jgi:hypothetical protein